MTDTSWYLAILGVGLGSYMLRVSPFIWTRCLQWGKDNIPFLTCVSLAIAAGIVSKALFMQGSKFIFDIDTLFKCAAVICALALYRWKKNLLLCLFAGVAMAILLKLMFTSLNT